MTSEEMLASVAAAVTRADAAEAEVASLRAYLRVATADAVGLVERVHRAVQTHQGVVRERDAARARCAAVCREVARFYAPGDVGSVVALACADEIERAAETDRSEAHVLAEDVAAERTRREAAEAAATRSADAAVNAVRELGHVAAAAVARADAAEARLAALAAAVREDRAVTAEHEHAWAAHITADDLAGAEEVLALDARLDAARAALDAALVEQ